ncbi:MAG: ATP-binding protein [Sulfuricellaceae bacterium]|jgi:two-component system NtrC family sensor kinase
MKRIPSLGRKITLGYLGYYTLAALVTALALFTYGEMRYIEKKVLAGGHVTEFFDATLEIRRFEKNFFLYRQNGDLVEARRFADEAKALLQDNKKDFAPLASPSALSDLQAKLDSYRGALADIPKPGNIGTARESALRQLGKEVVDAAEKLVKTERKILQGALDRARTIFIVSVAALGSVMLALGFMLSRLVVRPLKHMERCVVALTEGHREKLHLDSEDHEIVAISSAFNRMLDELELRQRGLLRAEKLAAMGTMLSGVAHELNNPLSNISTSCQILVEEFNHNDREHQRELLAQIDEETHRASQIVRTLLDFARDREVRKSRFFLRSLAEETLRLLQCQRHPCLEVRLDIPESLAIVGERQRLQQALLNLLQNAQQASPAGGIIAVTARETTASEFSQDFTHGLVIINKCPAGRRVVEIRISDEGGGIPTEMLPRVFDPFFTTKDVGQGSGLGLFVVHQIIEEHDGCIRLDSTFGKGTQITLLLPLSDETPITPSDGTQP